MCWCLCTYYGNWRTHSGHCLNKQISSLAEWHCAKHVQCEQKLRAAWENPYQRSCRQHTYLSHVDKDNTPSHSTATAQSQKTPLWYMFPQQSHINTWLYTFAMFNTKQWQRENKIRAVFTATPKRQTSISVHLNPSGAGRLSQHWWRGKPNEEAFDEPWGLWILHVFAKLSKLKQAWCPLYSYSDSELVI